MYRRGVRAAAVAIVWSGLLGGCATVVSGTSQNVVVESEPEGATCSFKRGGITLGATASTPAKFTLERHRDDLLVTCTRDGYEPTTEVVESKFTGATVGNLLVGGLIGVVVDAASGANYKYPEHLIVVMLPASLPDAAARDAHLAQSAGRVKEVTASQIKAIQGRCLQSQRELCQIEVKRIEDARDRALAGIERKRADLKVAAPAPPS